ncbi:MAG: class I SAM-dependent methyltransferase [Ardenticatenaceae bacterium]|nr:class I SAM-dependent methyltransferase [Ardenticatenaceae bacterium]
MRVDYDKIAHLYDHTPHRGKEVDAYLLAFLAERGQTAVPPRILDLGCGTGSQLTANQGQIGEAQWVGLDLSAGMLQQAQQKSASIHWLQGNNAHLPFAHESFAYISNQFSFHHVQDKVGMVAEVYRVLAANGRFVMQNIAPREMPGWVYYHYFPAAYPLDLNHYLPLADLQALLAAAGFVNIQLKRSRFHYEQDLAQFWALAQDRVAASQLIAIADEAYAAGLARLQADIAAGAATFSSEICLITLCADKPGGLDAD